MKFDNSEIDFLTPSDTSLEDKINQIAHQLGIKQVNADNLQNILTWILINSTMSQHERMRLIWVIGKKCEGAQFSNEVGYWNYLMNNPMYQALMQVDYLYSINATPENFTEMTDKLQNDECKNFVDNYQFNFKDKCQNALMALRIKSMMDAYQRRLDTYPENDTLRYIKQSALNELQKKFEAINLHDEQPFYQLSQEVARQTHALSQHRDHFQFLMKISATLHQKANQLYGKFFTSKGPEMTKRLKHELPQDPSDDVPMSIIARPSA